MLLQSLPYHLQVRDYFKKQLKTWNFFAAAATRDEQRALDKMELLKNTYKFDPVSDANLYAAVTKAKTGLGLDSLPVTVYQANYSDDLNASVIFLDKEAHIVFSGRFISTLDEHELVGVMAHELAHVKLYSMLDGDLEIADRIIHAIANNRNSDAVYQETARLYRLYTEIFCDRGAYSVLEDIHPVITGLVKVATGLERVSAENYLKQAEEIFASDNLSKVSAFSHPENYIRAKALQLWHLDKETAGPAIIRMIEGVNDLDQLDIFKQEELTALTRKFISLFLKPNWIRSTLITGHAKSYFPDFRYNDNAELSPAFTASLEMVHNSVRDYLCYVLLDFSLADPSLEEIPFGWAFQFSEAVYLKEHFEAAVKKELKYSDKRLQQYRKSALAAYYDVKENESEQIYE